MLKVLDLFSGIGGFSLGLEWTGHFKTVGFCEANEKAAAILRKRWPDVPIFCDIRNLNKDMIHEKVDVICGGFPCQDISLAGKGAGLVGERSGLWFEMHRLIKEIKPKYVIAENVSALRSRGLDRVLGSLAEIGYDAEWHCIPASAVGLFHRRDRIWIVAYTDGMRLQGLKKPTDITRRWQEHEKQLERLLEISRGVAIPTRSGSGVHDGISGRVDRLKQLGNAVVPHIPMMIGQAIHDHHCNTA